MGMIFAVGALFVGALLFMAATSPRAFVVLLTLALLSFGAWYVLSPSPEHENQPPPRVMPP